MLISGQMTTNANVEMWFQEMDRTNPLDTSNTKSEERPEGSLNAEALAEGQKDNSPEGANQSPEVVNQSPEVASMCNLEGTSRSEELRINRGELSTSRTQDVNSNKEERLDSGISEVRPIMIHWKQLKDIIYPGLDWEG